MVYVVKPIQLPENQRKKLIELIKELTGADEKDAERIERLITKYHPRKIVVALNSMVQYDWKKRKKKPISLEELEKKIDKVRF